MVRLHFYKNNTKALRWLYGLAVITAGRAGLLRGSVAKKDKPQPNLTPLSLELETQGSALTSPNSL
jgi:hypothetical protein